MITKDTHKIITANGKEAAWIFDIKNILLQPETLSLMTDLFWQHFEKDYPFQVGGQELAAVPLVTAIVLRGQQIGKPVNGFIIRKSRKPNDLQKIIEGQVNQEKIILVDDIINSGSTVLRQIKVMAGMGKNISALFTILNFRGGEAIEAFQSQSIALVSLFTLDDFGLQLEHNQSFLKEPFKVDWVFRCPNPSYHHRVPKSTPCLSQDKVFFGSDGGFFYALNQQNGTIAWTYEVGYPVQGKSIFSAPALYKQYVYFGAYDGNVYALNKDSGQEYWKYTGADFVGSSPALAPDLGLLFIGLEFGLIRKRGGLAALDLKTGKLVWDFRMEQFVHSSPAYCPHNKTVYIGCNEGYVYAFHAKDGTLRWKFKTGSSVLASFDFDLKRNLVFFGSLDKKLYVLDMDTGEEKGVFETKEGIYATPKVIEDTVYIPSTDKQLYSLNIETGALNWRFQTGGRIFSSPEVVDGTIYIGATDGKLYAIDPESGKQIASFQTAERITNPVIYNPKTKRFFLLTYANELYCLNKD